MRTPETAAGPEAPLFSLSAANGLRGPGAIAIALAHFLVVTDAVERSHLTPIALFVDLFFVLSGLVIAQAYGAKLSRNGGAIPEYVVRRVGRIWPVQAATLGLLVLWELTKLAAETMGAHFHSPAFSRAGLNLVEAIGTNLTLVQSLGIHDRETWNFPSWSLSVEFVTYVLFAAFCLLPALPRRALAVATVLGSIAVLVLVAPDGMRSTFDYGIFRCLAGFFAGTLCFEALARWGAPRWRFPTLVEAAAVGALGLWIAGGAGERATFAAPLVFPLLLAAFCGRGGAITRLLRRPGLQYLAELSFSLYMVHALVLIGLLTGLHALARPFGLPLFRAAVSPSRMLGGVGVGYEALHPPGPLSFVLILAIYAVGVAVATLAAHRWIEVPGRALFARLAKTVSAGRSGPQPEGAIISRRAIP